MQFINDFFTKLVVRVQNAKAEEGQTVIEYGLIAALLSVVAGAAFGLLSDDIQDLVTSIEGQL